MLCFVLAKSYLCGKIVYMESNKHDELFKNRGLGATLKAAYNMFLARFQFVLKHLWPAALFFAVFASLLVSMPYTFGGQPSLWLFLPLFLLAIVATVVLYSRIAQLLNGQSWKWNLGRMVKLILVSVGVNLLVAVIVGVVWILAWLLFAPQESSTPVEAQLSVDQIAAASLKILSVVGIVSLVLCVLMVPLTFSYTKYVVDTKSQLREIFGSSYRQGLRHWGYIFSTIVLSSLLIMLVVVVLCLPLIIVNAAQIINMQGMAHGDASGMPGGFGWIVYIVSAATYFVLSFVLVFCAFVCYYMYGTVEVRQKEREAGDKMSAIKIAEEGV